MNKKSTLVFLLVLAVIFASGCVKSEKESPKVIERNTPLEILHVYRMFGLSDDGNWAVDFKENNSHGFSTINSRGFFTSIEVRYNPKEKESLVLTRSVYDNYPISSGSTDYYVLTINDSTFIQGASMTFQNGKIAESYTTETLS